MKCKNKERLKLMLLGNYFIIIMVTFRGPLSQVDISKNLKLLFNNLKIIQK